MVLRVLVLRLRLPKQGVACSTRPTSPSSRRHTVTTIG